MPELTLDTAANLPDGISVEIADLSPEGQAQVIDALNAVQDGGGLDDATAERLLADAQRADDHRDTVEDLRDEEAAAIAAGDHDATVEAAQDIVYELKAVEATGGTVDSELIQAEGDLSHHQQGSADADAAQELADMATNAGSAEAAATSMDSAANYAEASSQETAAAAHTYDAVAPADDAGATATE